MEIRPSMLTSYPLIRYVAPPERQYTSIYFEKSMGHRWSKSRGANITKTGTTLAEFSPRESGTKKDSSTSLEELNGSLQLMN